MNNPGQASFAKGYEGRGAMQDKWTRMNGDQLGGALHERASRGPISASSLHRIFAM